MKNLNKAIMKDLRKNTIGQIDKTEYIDLEIVSKIISIHLDKYSKIIINSNLQDDFVEGLEELLKRELTIKEIKKLTCSGTLDDCIDKMLETESELILNYYNTFLKK